MKYRKDIDGLRALAVMLVIFDHMKFPYFDGGFLGVDVFFAISGFLITTILIKNLESNTFSFKGFYVKRIKRIFPVLIFILIVASLINIILLNPVQLKEYISFLPYTIFGLGNIAAANLEIGYFDQAVERHQLLHTWSLGVEEQFYLLIPLFLFFLWKIDNRKIRKNITLLILVLSVALSFYFVEYTNFSKNNYYMLHTRFFEIFIGVSLAIFYNDLPEIKNKYLGSTISLTLIIILFLSSLYFNGDSSWPGLNALLIVFVTTLLLYTGGKSRDNFISNRVLGFPPIVFLGKISYSLYLWHWIIISLGIEIGLEFEYFSVVGKLLFLILFLVPISYLSWRYIENHFRYGSKLDFAKPFTFWIAIPSLASFLLLWISYNNEELLYNKKELDKTTYKYIIKTPHKVVKNINKVTKELSFNYNRNEILIGDLKSRKFNDSITQTDILSAEVLILANSHFNSLKQPIDFQLKEMGYVGHVMEERKVNVYSFQKAEKIYSKLLENKKFILIAVRHSGQNFGNTNKDWREWLIEKAFENGVIPIIMIPSIEIESDAMARRNQYTKKIFNFKLDKMQKADTILPQIQNIQEVEVLYKKYNKKVRWLDIKPLLCVDGKFQLWFNNEFILFDDNHLIRKVGNQLGNEYNIRYGNIFASKWEQPPVLTPNLFYSKYNQVSYFSKNNTIYRDSLYTIKKDLDINKIKIRKKFRPIVDDMSNFFLHIYTKNPNDLPEKRKKIGFDNIYCKKRIFKTIAKNEVYMIGDFKLPKYEIDSIKIGHYMLDGKRKLDLKISW